MDRPTGAALGNISALSGFAAFIAGLFLLVAEQADTRILCAAIVGLGIQLAIFTGIAGQIVRAIWFLPADPAKVGDQEN